jgi:hypothetical protein
MEYNSQIFNKKQAVNDQLPPANKTNKSVTSLPKLKPESKEGKGSTLPPIQKLNASWQASTDL